MCKASEQRCRTFQTKIQVHDVVIINYAIISITTYKFTLPTHFLIITYTKQIESTFLYSETFFEHSSRK